VRRLGAALGVGPGEQGLGGALTLVGPRVGEACEQAWEGGALVGGWCGARGRGGWWCGQAEWLKGEEGVEPGGAQVGGEVGVEVGAQRGGEARVLWGEGAGAEGRGEVGAAMGFVGGE
jgi:hypothetical protein